MSHKLECTLFAMQKMKQERRKRGEKTALLTTFYASTLHSLNSTLFILFLISDVKIAKFHFRRCEERTQVSE